MARQTEQGIGWCQETWNPVRGCSPVGDGCRNCWAVRMAAQFSKPGERYHGFVSVQSAVSGLRYENPSAAGDWVAPRWTGRVELIEHELERPLRRRKLTVYAVALMADWMHENLADEARDRILAVEALCPQHRFIHLTKRWERQARYLSELGSRPGFNVALPAIHGRAKLIQKQRDWPLRNIIIGASAWDQCSADEAWHWLSETPAACRLQCLEPLLGPVDLTRPHPVYEHSGPILPGTQACQRSRGLIDWIIIGPETGPHRRNCEWSWIRGVVQQCKAAGVPCWVKALLDSRGRKLPFDDWPSDLRVREAPWN